MSIQKNNSKNKIFQVVLALVLLAGLLGTAIQPTAAAGNTRLTVLSVQKGLSVTIRVINMPANTAVQIRMNTFGTNGLGGAVAGTTTTDGDGAFTGTFSIPFELRETGRLAIRVEVSDKPRQFISTWFTNQTGATTSTTTTSGATTNSGSSGSSAIPTGTANSGSITIDSVVEDKSVTVEAAFAPKNARLAVWIDWKTQTGVFRGVQIGTVKSDQDGEVSGTFRLPPAASDRVQLRFRLQGTGSTTFAAYTWFENGEDDEDTGSGTPSSYSGPDPYIKVVEVDEGDSVTIKAYNFPDGQYEILMDEVGSGARNGIEVDTIDIDEDKTFTGTFEIPEDLEDEDEIAIRVQGADNSRYYAYTWFKN